MPDEGSASQLGNAGPLEAKGVSGPPSVGAAVHCRSSQFIKHIGQRLQERSPGEQHHRSKPSDTARDEGKPGDHLGVSLRSEFWRCDSAEETPQDR